MPVPPGLDGFHNPNLRLFGYPKVELAAVDKHHCPHHMNGDKKVCWSKGCRSLCEVCGFIISSFFGCEIHHSYEGFNLEARCSARSLDLETEFSLIAPLNDLHYNPETWRECLTNHILKHRQAYWKKRKVDKKNEEPKDDNDAASQLKWLHQRKERAFGASTLFQTPDRKTAKANSSRARRQKMRKAKFDSEMANWGTPTPKKPKWRDHRTSTIDDNEDLPQTA